MDIGIQQRIIVVQPINFDELIALDQNPSSGGSGVPEAPVARGSDRVPAKPEQDASSEG